MAQVFRAPELFALKLAGLGLLVVIAVAWVTLYKALPAHSGALSPQQPIAFSHKHHVGDDGIDCRYCHTSVETSSFAGIPPTDTCMGCHSQIWNTAEILEPVRASLRSGKSLEWTRVHDLPDFVFFNHSIHVNKGIGCSTCHGRIDQMPLTRKVNTLFMQWCIECHRAPQNYIRPRDQVFNMVYQYPDNQEELGPQLVKEYKVQSLTDCVTCHR